MDNKDVLSIDFKEFDTILKALRNFKIKDAALQGCSQSEVDGLFNKCCIIKGITVSEGDPQMITLIKSHAASSVTAV